MVQEIISKWVIKYKNWDLIITSDKKVIDCNTKNQLVECWNNGTISYRVPGTSKKIGIRTINKYCRKEIKVIQEHIPF